MTQLDDFKEIIRLLKHAVKYYMENLDDVTDEEMTLIFEIVDLVWEF